MTKRHLNTGDLLMQVVVRSGGRYLEVLGLGKFDGQSLGKLIYFAAGDSDFFTEIRHTLHAISPTVHFLCKNAALTPSQANFL